MPLADPGYFPGMGNSVTFISPGRPRGIAGRLTYSSLSGLFSLIWDEATTAEVPEPLATALCQTDHRRPGRTPSWCPSTPPWASTSTTRRPTTST